MSMAVLEEKREPKLLERVRDAIRVRHMSLRTEKAYLHWIRRYILFHGKRHPQEMGEAVTFTWKDYARGQRLQEMTLSGEEFLRRFLLHVLPERFVRIRYYGLLANRHREQELALCHEVLPGSPALRKLTKSDWRSLLQNLTGMDPMRCEVCGRNTLHLVGDLAPAQVPRAPPQGSCRS